MSEANELALSGRVRGLCEDYSNRPYIVRRGVLSTLIKFLQHTSRDVQFNAAEALKLLSEHPENPEPMCKERGLLQALATAYQNTEGTDVEIFNLVADVVANLEAALDRKDQGRPSEGPQVNETQSAMTTKNRGNRIVHSVVGRTRTVVLDVPAMTENLTRDLGDLLECTRGVVSYTLDPMERTATLYTSTPTPTLLRLLEDKGFVAVVRSESNPQPRSSAQRRSSTAIPQYLTGKGAEGSDYMKTLVLHGMDTNSLSSRVERQKLEKARQAKEKNARQVGQIQGFFQKMTAGWW
eukprot:PhM_4_TR2731/c0_g1_i1/m.100180